MGHLSIQYTVWDISHYSMGHLSVQYGTSLITVWDISHYSVEISLHSTGRLSIHIYIQYGTSIYAVWEIYLQYRKFLIAVWDIYLYRIGHIYIRQRSWANVMYSSPFVCVFVCLSVCLLAGLLKKLWTDLNEILCDGSQLPKDHSIKF